MTGWSEGYVFNYKTGAWEYRVYSPEKKLMAVAVSQSAAKKMVKELNVAKNTD